MANLILAFGDGFGGSCSKDSVVSSQDLVQSAMQRAPEAREAVLAA